MPTQKATGPVDIGGKRETTMSAAAGKEVLMEKVGDLVREMIILADEGEAQATDDGCVVLCSVVRDSAYRIRAEIDRETERHRQGAQ